MRMHVAACPGGKTPVTAERENVAARKRLESLIGRARESAADALHLVRRKRRGTVFYLRPLGFDFVAKARGRAGLHQDLDARFPDVVAAAVAVVNAQDRFEVREQMGPRQEFADDRAEHG